MPYVLSRSDTRSHALVTDPPGGQNAASVDVLVPPMHFPPNSSGVFPEIFG